MKGRNGTVELQRVNIKVIMSFSETNTDLCLCNTLPFIKIFMCFDPESKIQRLKWQPFSFYWFGSSIAKDVCVTRDYKFLQLQKISITGKAAKLALIKIRLLNIYLCSTNLSWVSTKAFSSPQILINSNNG